MISPLDDSDEPSFVIGDVQGSIGASYSISCYIKSPSGFLSATMSNLWDSKLQELWIGTGQSLERPGARKPVVSGMVINGKSYVAVLSGGLWEHAAAVLEPDLTTLAHENLNLCSPSLELGWSFGGWVDWYWNEDAGEAYLAVWFGRVGLYTYTLTCFE
jgi:hypothetical protein